MPVMTAAMPPDRGRDENRKVNMNYGVPAQPKSAKNVKAVDGFHMSPSYDLNIGKVK